MGFLCEPKYTFITRQIKEQKLRPKCKTKKALPFLPSSIPLYDFHTHIARDYIIQDGITRCHCFVGINNEK